MIYLYPANKMENLLALVEKIQQISPLPVFSKEVFIVQNAGMQHWLNMSLANKRGISFNIDYALPAQFLWGLVRALVDKGDGVEQSPFSREAMSWRIYVLLGENIVLEDEEFSAVTGYWLKHDQASSHHLNKNFTKQENLKRYQLACQLADLFEQYLVFRPDWIDAWQAGKFSQSVLAELNESCFKDNFHTLEKWQAKLWQFLVAEQDYNPLNLLEKAQDNLANHAHLIPKRICLFGINAMAPMWLSFINALSDVTEVHFFHLNPCVDYWGDILSEKQAIKNSERWTADHQLNNDSVGNPLLANLGQQGREFLVLLQQYSTVNIDAFEKTAQQRNSTPPSVLAHIQDDILTLFDRRSSPTHLQDDSIVITSAHSALREVQGLHDWLLHQFNEDDELTPKDVLVMCPQVETYAPYVNAVFARGWQELDNDIPPLPCSISDRTAKDSEPLVAAFSELLTLPDSRFQVSQILAWLRLPAMQTKFGIQVEEIEKYSLWIEHACIHWGLNVAHKQSILGVESIGEQFTWQYGLRRLLTGFAFSDQDTIYENQLVLADVEGSDAIALGKLMLIIEQLQYFTHTLNTPRTPQDWHQFLLTFIEQIFETNQDDNFNTIFSAIELFVEYCQHANFDQKIELTILREFLDAHFSQPEPGRQFMVGQVTFCSMLPMRSIPFKVVAILGLNDGEYPRQRPPLGFDLMSLSSSRVGDRSRRGDDRYLFLEAIISARQALYLSYQGRSIKNNNPKQPSLVLKELMDYLEHAFGWSLLTDNTDNLRQLAMQPYSEKNYLGKYAGFDEKWLTLSPLRQLNKQATSDSLLIKDVSDKEDSLAVNGLNLTVSVHELTRFFIHPSRFFAQSKLSLYLDNQTETLQDTEPFDSDHLSRYLFKEKILNGLISPTTEDSHLQDIALSEDGQTSINFLENIKQEASLSGKFPQLPHQDVQLEKLIGDSIYFVDYVKAHCLADITTMNLTLTLPILVNNEQGTQEKIVEIETKIQICDDKLVQFRSSSPKIKDFLGLYFNLLIVEVWLENNDIDQALDEETQVLNRILRNIKSSHGFYFKSNDKKTLQYYYPVIDNPRQQLSQLLLIFIQGQSQALLLNSDIAHIFYKTNDFNQQQFEQFWNDDYNKQAFGQDPYIEFFWPQCPDFSEIQAQLMMVYDVIINQLQQVK
ncbi:exodeoxyribonuclease V subunit gamma [Thalassotalea sp. SU-HH00458]|uniref:exodeoxyribonuclease V subunit gamma n=1 Tax=Thalassotalea sp. SU-HH00458 TaxID=3127657 RepID=UPI0033656574